MTEISPAEATTPGWTIVDVRSASERAAASVAGSLHIPLETVERHGARLRGLRIALLCKAGTRARMARQRLAALGIDSAVITGGLDRWRRDGLPVSRTTPTRWSLERQVRLVAGSLGLTGTLLAVFVDTHWLWLTGFVGAGLTFAGLTDLCLMGNLLARLPWNRIRSGT